MVLRRGRFADPFLALMGTERPLAVVLYAGHLGVGLFFLITGFLLVLPWLRRATKGGSPPSAQEFYVRRIRRIVPAYYAQLALLCLVWVPPLHGPGFRRQEPSFLLFNLAARDLAPLVAVESALGILTGRAWLGWRGARGALLPPQF